jgi:hypothetical protein
MDVSHPLYSDLYARLQRLACGMVLPMRSSAFFSCHQPGLGDLMQPSQAQLLAMAAPAVDAAPPLLPPSPLPPDDADPGPEPERVVWITGVAKPGPDDAPVTPEAAETATVACVPCRAEDATVAVARVAPSRGGNGVQLLLAACAYVAALHGWGEEALACLAAVPDDDAGGHRRSRALLRGMMDAGVPVLLPMGHASRERALKYYGCMSGMVRAGSPLLVCDELHNVIMLAVPMGQLVYVPEGEQGVLPAEVRALGPAPAAATCLELWVRPVCVADYDALAHDAWFKAPHFKYAADFNWAVETVPVAPGFRNVASQSASAILPNGQPIVALFKNTRLGVLAWYIRDFVAKLARLDRVPLKARGSSGRWPESERKAREAQHVNDPAVMFYPWRRAVLLRAVLDLADPHGNAHRALGPVLPASLLALGRQLVLPPSPAPEPAPFRPADLRREAAAAALDRVLALVAGVQPMLVRKRRFNSR